MTQAPRLRYLPARSSLSKRGLSLALQSAVALAWAVLKRLYVVVPVVLFTVLAVASGLTGKSVVLAPHYFWILAALVAVGGLFLQYHHERLARIECEERPITAIARLLTLCRDLKAAIRHGVVRGDEARQAFDAFVRWAGRVVRARAPFYLDTWETARGPIEGGAWLEALERLEEALVAIGRGLASERT